MCQGRISCRWLFSEVDTLRTERLRLCVLGKTSSKCVCVLPDDSSRDLNQGTKAGIHMQDSLTALIQYKGWDMLRHIQQNSNSYTIQVGCRYSDGEPGCIEPLSIPASSWKTFTKETSEENSVQTDGNGISGRVFMQTQWLGVSAVKKYQVEHSQAMPSSGATALSEAREPSPHGQATSVCRQMSSGKNPSFFWKL